MSANLPSDEQREQLCGLFHWAFIEMRSLASSARDGDAAQIYALADAFHEIPGEMFGEGRWDLSLLRKCLQEYQERFHSLFNYVAELDVIFGLAPYHDGDEAVFANQEDMLARLTRSIESNPTDVGWYLARARLYESRGDYEQAIADFEKAIEIQPSCAFLFGALAWILMTCPDKKCRDGARAISVARSYCDHAGWDYHRALEVLAAAYAEAGDFNEAARWQEKAIDALPKDLLREAMTQQLARYRHGRKFKPNEYTGWH